MKRQERAIRKRSMGETQIQGFAIVHYVYFIVNYWLSGKRLYVVLLSEPSVQ
jgi:hypothetical protein